MGSLVYLVLALCLAPGHGATVKKSKTAEAAVAEKVSPPSSTAPIIAIEIVDPNENSTKGNAKRTIESSLGYGMHSGYTSAHNHGKKYMIYPYSQRDIPPYRGLQAQTFNTHSQQNYVKLPPIFLRPSPYHSQVPSYQGNYQAPALNIGHFTPGTVLFSTLGNSGHIGGLSSQVPFQNQVHSGPIPVIILRVYSNQLSDPSAPIYPNLPQSHPYAHNLNSINLQTLLAMYIQQQALKNAYHQVPPVAYQPTQPVYQTNYHQNNYADQQADQPDYPDTSYQQPQQEQQYDYNSKDVHQNNYEPEQPTTYQHQQQPQVYEQEQHSESLPTSENYPDEKHTRVIFYNQKTHAQPQQTKVSTIPANLVYSTTITSVEGTSQKAPVEHGYANVQVSSPGSHYAYAMHDDQQGYVYIRPKMNHVQEQLSHQQQSPDYDTQYDQQYQYVDANADQGASVEYMDETVSEKRNLPPVATQKSPDAPYNYHAHPRGDRQRSKKSNVITSHVYEQTKTLAKKEVKKGN